MSNMSERYGLDNKVVTSLWQKWIRLGKADRSWKSFDAFVLWCRDTGYEPGLELKKNENNRPHGPTNSYWFRWEKPAATVKETQEPVCSFCADCVQDCPSPSEGCKSWREWYISNWNRNICRKPLELRASRPGVFVYEHPDAIREGIV